MIIHYYYVVIFQFLVHAAALWSALHGLVGVLDVQICNNMINIQAGYLKYKYKYKCTNTIYCCHRSNWKHCLYCF